MTIATAKATLTAGENKSVKLSLNRVGRALLKAHHHLPAALTMRVGKTVIATKKLSLTAHK